MKKIAKIIAALIVTNLFFPYCTSGETQLAIAEEAVGVTVYSLYSTKNSVDGLYMWLDDIDTETGIDRALLNDEKNCYWIQTITETPDMPRLEDLWMYLYKDSNTGATHLTVDEEVVRFIGNNGGLGVTSVALGDLNNDGLYEIYFTYSWDNGTYCSQVGYFDIQTKEVCYLGDYMYPDGELVLTAENGVLTVCKAELTEYTDKVHIELEANDSIAEIVCNDGEIGIEPISNEFVKLPEKLVPTEKPIPDWLPKSADESNAFMKENGEIFIKDGYICYMMYISGADSFRGYRICPSENSDVKAPVSYKKYEDDYYGEYIVSCFELPPDSYIEICDDRYYSKSISLCTYISDENGNITEAFKGDVNSDGEVAISDLVSLQKYLLGKDGNLNYWQLADICDDNEINVYDLVMLRKLIIEKK